MNTGQDLLDTFCQSPLVFVEPADANARFGVFPFRMLSELHVATDRHEIHDIVGQKIEPVAEPTLIEQVGFHEQEVFHIGLELIVGVGPPQRVVANRAGICRHGPNRRQWRIAH